MTVLGLPLVLANINRIAAQIVGAESRGVAEAAELIRDAWVRNIESEGIVDTGRYRDSVTVVVEGDQAGVVTDVEYARFLEYGTSRMPAHPAAERAYDEHGDRAVGVIGGRVARVIR